MRTRSQFVVKLLVIPLDDVFPAVAATMVRPPNPSRTHA